MKNGINKLLYEQRLSLGLNERKAARLIKTTKLELHLVERGYIPIRKKLKNRIIKAYKLPDTFFDDDYLYPEEILGEKKESKLFSKIDELLKSIKVRIACWVLTACFTGMAIGGVCLNSDIASNTQNYFSDDVLALRSVAFDHGTRVVEDIHDSAFIQMLVDSYYSYSNAAVTERKMEVSINYFRLNQNIPYTFFKGISSYSSEGTDYTVRFETRAYIDGSYRTKMKLLKSAFGIDKKLLNVTANSYKDGTNKIFEIQALNENDEMVTISTSNPEYEVYASFYKTKNQVFTDELQTFFETDGRINTITTFKQYSNNLANNVGCLSGYRIASGALIILGAAFAILCFACSFVYLFRKSKATKDFEDNIEEISFEDKETSKKKKKALFKPNWRFFPPLPETLIRVSSIALLMAGSIGVYFIYDSIVHTDVSRIVGSAAFYAIFNSLTIIGIVCIFFMKLDIYQNKKSVFLINYSLFFLGLGYYILLVLVKSRLCIGEGAISTFGNYLLKYIPGNSVWGILAFNILIMFLFYEPKSYQNDPDKLRKYRLMCIIPLSYLIVSGVLSIGKENFGWNIPFEIYSLFFSKSAILVIFAIAFVFCAYFYKKAIYKKFSKEKADNYCHGRKFFFTKNLIASCILLILGLSALIVHYVDKGNGFGQNYLILFCIPGILLYHPHLGKRIGWFDDIMTVLYGLSLCLGIVILAISSLSFIYML